MIQAEMASTATILKWFGVAAEAVSLFDFLEGKSPAGSRWSEKQFVDRSGRAIFIHARKVGIR
jgi:hypothetical protein